MQGHWGVFAVVHGSEWLRDAGDSLKIKLVLFNGTPPHFVHFGNKIVPAKYEKIEKSLGGATGQWTFVHKVNGIYVSFSLQHKKVMLISPDCGKN